MTIKGRNSLVAAPSLILASGSTRRAALLAELHVPFRVIVSDEPEVMELGLTPEVQALQLAELKARAVAVDLSHGLVLGADTIVVLDGQLIGKPADDDDAARMLRLLRGRDHAVVTGVALVDGETGTVNLRAVTSTVHVRPLSDREILDYVASGEPRDKAGAYAIQGIGGQLIANLSGCFNNVVGLPLCAVSALLTDAGVPIPSTWTGCLIPDGSLCPEMV